MLAAVRALQYACITQHTMASRQREDKITLYGWVTRRPRTGRVADDDRIRCHVQWTSIMGFHEESGRRYKRHRIRYNSKRTDFMTQKHAWKLPIQIWTDNEGASQIIIDGRTSNKAIRYLDSKYKYHIISEVVTNDN
eukprot:Awhi_evm1s10539